MHCEPTGTSKFRNYAVLFFMALAVSSGRAEQCQVVPDGDVFKQAEDYGYCEFVTQAYTDGLRAPAWGGVFTNYLEQHGIDTPGENRNHRVATESTSLLAQLAVLRGDKQTLDEMVAIWMNQAYHYEPMFQITHWILNPDGNKVPFVGLLQNASGEEARMLEVLTTANDLFVDNTNPSCPASSTYNDCARTIAKGMIGVGGGQGVFEPVCPPASAIDGSGGGGRARPPWAGVSLEQTGPTNRPPRSQDLLVNTIEASGFLLRPWFQWDESDKGPVSNCSDPMTTGLNLNNFVGYYNVVTKLDDMELTDFFDQVLSYTIGTINMGQSEVTGAYWPQYDLHTGELHDEHGNMECSVLACADIATRLAAYGYAAGELDSVDSARPYLEFLEGKYRSDGVLWSEYHHDTGELIGMPMEENLTNFASYVFLAKMAIVFRQWDLAEKVLREQVLPFQVTATNDHPSYSDEGYRGAFKKRVDRTESEMHYANDATAFDNLEALVTLNLWNNADKGSWTSSYPIWKTAAAVDLTSASSVPDNSVETLFAPELTRYVRILGRTRALPQFGYSIKTLEILDQNGQSMNLETAVASVSSIENFSFLGQYAADGTDQTRWASEFEIDPQWIYLDLGEPRLVTGVKILWENAYATLYNVQVGIDPSTFIFADGFESGGTSRWSETAP